MKVKNHGQKIFKHMYKLEPTGKKGEREKVAMLCCDPSVLDGMFVCNSRRADYASLFVFHKIHSTQSIGRHRKFLFLSMLSVIFLIA